LVIVEWHTLLSFIMDLPLSSLVFNYYDLVINHIAERLNTKNLLC